LNKFISAARFLQELPRRLVTLRYGAFAAVEFSFRVPHALILVGTDDSEELLREFTVTLAHSHVRHGILFEICAAVKLLKRSETLFHPIPGDIRHPRL
jgi:hypothetical protein